MSGINKVTIVGNLGKDPETFTFDNGTKKTSFSMAVTESYKNKDGERIENTEWINIVTWRGLAEVAEKYLSKGMKIYIEGKLKTRSWEDKEGKKHYITEIYADHMLMLSKKSGPEVHPESEIDIDSGLPF